MGKTLVKDATHASLRLVDCAGNDCRQISEISLVMTVNEELWSGDIGGLVAPVRSDRLLEQILDRFVRATFVVTANFELLYHNAAARTLSGAKSFVQNNEGRLHFVDRSVLKHIADYFVDESRRQKTVLLPSVTDRRAPGQPTYRLLVTPLETPVHGMDRRVWLLFISEFSNERHIDGAVLERLYGLTRSEAQLVSSLFAGSTLNAAAASRNVSINTARTLLRRVFQKCEVQSQGELLQLVALGPRTL